jgi:flagellar hook-associated protein 3 FlgL
MTMRTPNPMNNSQSLLDLQRTKERYSNLVTQLTTGSRIVNVGDDPTGSALIMDFQSSITRNNQYMSQIDNATNLLTGTETALDAVNNTVTRLLELGQQGMSETNGASGRTAISAEVATLGTDLVSTANTQEQGKYIFAGTRTTTMPFSGTVPANPPYTTQTVGYNGDDSEINLDVSISSKVTTNLPGSTVFYGSGGAGSSTDLFAAVEALKTGLQNNDTAGIKTAYDNLQAIAVHINDSITLVGGRQAGMDTLKTGLSSYNATLTTIQGNVGAVDYPTAITSLNKETVAQQATLSVMAKAGGKSLFDYLA